MMEILFDCLHHCVYAEMDLVSLYILLSPETNGRGNIPILGRNSDEDFDCFPLNTVFAAVDINV